jgi:two-component system sensor histidine kinase DegS
MALDPRTVDVHIDRAEQSHSFVAVPLKGQSGNVGVIVNSHKDVGLFTERDLQLLTTFADYATIALSNARLYSSLQQREDERSRLLHQLLTSQDAERRRVAVDIHDGPLQSIGVNILAVDRARKLVGDGRIEQGLAELVALRGGMSAVVQELRDVINDLRPALLENLGLVVAAESHLKAFGEQNGVPVHIEDELDGYRLPHTLEVILYRLMQETLTNVRKHAGASTVWVRFMRHDNTAIMSITDNGRGFEPTLAVPRALASGHIGIHSMQERIEVVGGGMEIDSTPGQGTCITFRAPIE